MISIGTSHNTFHLFRGKITAKRKGEICRSVNVGRTERRQRFRGIIHPFQLHALVKREIRRSKANLDETGVLGQQPLDDVDVHLVAVSANRMGAVYIPMTVYEVIHITVEPLSIRNHILKIEFFRFGK